MARKGVVVVSRNRRNRQNRSTKPPEVPVDTVVWRGPWPRPGPADTFCDTQVIDGQFQVTTSASTLSFVIASNYLVTAEPLAWQEFTAAYKEVRILGFRLRYEPVTFEANSAYGGGVGAMAVVHATDVFAPTNVQTLIQNPDYKIWNAVRRLNIEWRMSSEEDGVFAPVASLAAVGSIKAALTPIGSTGTIGTVFYSFVAQFRTRNSS